MRNSLVAWGRYQPHEPPVVLEEEHPRKVENSGSGKVKKIAQPKKGKTASKCMVVIAGTPSIVANEQRSCQGKVGRPRVDPMLACCRQIKVILNKWTP